MGVAEAALKTVFGLRRNPSVQRPKTGALTCRQAVAGATARTEEADKALGVASRAGCALVGFGMYRRDGEARAVLLHAPTMTVRRYA